jgi:D-alanyl-D-alanine carboxypeptidase-like protein
MSRLQEEFAQSVARLIQKAGTLGYGVTLGEAWRTPEQAALNAKKLDASGNPVGISTSLHMERLAIDLNLFKDGVYITDDEGHRELGAWWKSLGPRYKWGGDFKRQDPNHYSISPDGVRA